MWKRGWGWESAAVHLSSTDYGVVGGGGLLTFVGEVSAADHGRVVHGSHVVAAADVDGAVVGPHAFGLVLALAGLAAAVVLALRVRPHFLDDAVGARLGEASVFPSDGVVVL
jgi:hypothetical protein